MRAQVGDRIVTKGRRVGEPERDGVILEVRGEDGNPPYLVRWDHSGQTALFVPGPDTVVQAHAD